MLVRPRSPMLFDAPTLKTALSTSLRAKGLSRGFLAWVILWLVLWGLIRSAVSAARLLDGLLYPGFRKVEVRQPVFILAQARSGTTLLQRLLAVDDDRFTTTKLYQTLIPSVLLHRLLGALGWLDRTLTGGLAVKAILSIEKRVFPAFRAVHPLALDQPEEDETFFVYTLLSPTTLMLFPFVEELDRVRSLENAPAEHRTRLMAYYRSCLQRHLYATGPHRTMLVKNVLAASRLEAMLEEFPDAQVIHLVRHPYQSIPSAISMFTLSWRRLLSAPPDEDPRYRAMGDLMMEYYAKVAEVSDALPDAQRYTLPFTTLVEDPLAAVKAIYAHFDWPMDDALEAKLQATLDERGTHKSTHRYGLEDFGMSRSDVAEDLGRLFDDHGFEA